MHGPPLLGWLLVAACCLAAGVCLLRARRGGRTPAQRQASAVEAAMGAGMAAMALPGGVVPWQLLLVVFGAVGVWSAVLLCRRFPHQLHHLAEAGAMLYMTVAMAAAAGGTPAGHGAHGAAPGGLPLLTGVLAAYFTLYALRTGLRLVPSPAVAGAGPPGLGGGPVPPAERAVDRPPVGAACRLTLALGMAAMLITL